MAEVLVDQADGLRRLLSGVPVQFVVLTSARPDRGRAWAVLNLAAALRLAGVGVMVVDPASGGPEGLPAPVANNWQCADVLAGRCRLEQALQQGPEGIPLLPARTGVAGISGSTPAAQDFQQALRGVGEGIEVVLVNLPSGEAGDQVPACLLEHELVIGVQPQREAVTAAYRLIRHLVQAGHAQSFRLLVTGASNIGAAQRVYRHLSAALERWLGARLDLLGVMPAESHLRDAASRGRTVVVSEPAAAAASSFRRMADSLIRLRRAQRQGAAHPSPFPDRAATVARSTSPLRG